MFKHFYPIIYDIFGGQTIALLLLLNIICDREWLLLNINSININN